MTTIYITKGLPASGKTTWARAVIDKNRDTVRVNKDDLRSMMLPEWSAEMESVIEAARDGIVSASLSSGRSVVCDDTNLHPVHEERLREIAEQHGATFEVVDFTDVPIEECIRRDRLRDDGVGEDVIRRHYDTYLVF